MRVSFNRFRLRANERTMLRADRANIFPENTHTRVRAEDGFCFRSILHQAVRQRVPSGAAARGIPQ